MKYKVEFLDPERNKARVTCSWGLWRRQAKVTEVYRSYDSWYYESTGRDLPYAVAKAVREARKKEIEDSCYRQEWQSVPLLPEAKVVGADRKV